MPRKIFKRAPTFMNRQAVALYRLVRFGFKPAGKGFVNGIPTGIHARRLMRGMYGGCMEMPINHPARKGGLGGGGLSAGVIVGGVNDHSSPCKKNRQGFAAFPIMENRR
ncbi:hypothetical protein [Streptomyces virginiae]|uniref:hypothetical protein n=1 Tax=Streptomyces virginiae TaxID=1961 RepID=UPI0035E0A6E4